MIGKAQRLGLLGLIVLTACGAPLGLPAAGVALGDAAPLWQCPTPALTATAMISPVAEGPAATDGPTATSEPTATPYYRSDVVFLGQDVYASPLRWTVHGVRSAAAPGGQMLAQIELELATTTAITVDLAAQLTVTEVRTADGRGLRGQWHATGAVAQPAPLPTALPAGGSWRGRVVIPVPTGTVTELQLMRDPQAAQISTQPQASRLVVRVQRDPWCVENIARPPLLPIGGVGGIDGTPIPIPPGGNPIVAFAVAHLGDPYVWGAKGPNAFDCSGLVYAAYATQLQIILPAGTTAPQGGQWAATTPIGTQALQPGDLLFFHTFPASPPPSHVGIYVGDLDGDGTGDMIHAANPSIGVVFQPNVLGNRYFMTHFVGARRVPGYGQP